MLEINKFFLNFMAMYPIRDNVNVIKKIFYNTWRIICILFMCTLCAQIAMNLIKRDKYDLIELTDNIINIGLFICAIIRVGYFYIKTNKLKTILDKLSDFKTESDNDICKVTLDKWIKITKYFSYVWYFNLFFTVEFMVFLPLFFMKKTGRILPLPAWYPIDTDKSPYFEIFYIYEALTNLFMGYAYANTDLVLVCVTTLLTGQYQILGTNIKNVFYNALLKYGISKSNVLKFSKNFNINGNKCFDNSNKMKNYYAPEIYQIIETEDFQDELHNELVRCIKQHQKIVAYSEDVEKFLSPILFPGILFGMFYLIFTTFCVVITEDNQQLFSQIMYMMTSLNEMFVITYFAQMLTTESERLNDTIYECPWYMGNKKFKSSYMIFKHLVRKPIVLTAGPFFSMSLSTFLVIVKTTSSYLAVLRQIVDRK